MLHKCWKNKMNKTFQFSCAHHEGYNGLTYSASFRNRQLCVYARFPNMVNTVNIACCINLLFNVTNPLQATVWKVNDIPYVTRNKPINVITLVLEFNLILLFPKAYNLCSILAKKYAIGYGTFEYYVTQHNKRDILSAKFILR